MSKGTLLSAIILRKAANLLISLSKEFTDSLVEPLSSFCFLLNKAIAETTAVIAPKSKPQGLALVTALKALIAAVALMVLPVREALAAESSKVTPLTIAIIGELAFWAALYKIVCCQAALVVTVER